MFAQTLAYGLFAARIHTSRSGQPFSHAEALLAVPKSNPFLRKIFSEMAGADMPTEFKWAVDDLVRLLQMSDIGEILKGFGKETGQNDPIVHFYETFLAAYDPKLREKRGVYYTPEPVVRYIVRSVDSLLKTHFGKPKGLADEKTLILDPATGTATFLYEVIKRIRESMRGQEGAWQGYVHERLLQRIFGFELLMAPYAVAHLKLGLELEQTGYQFAEGERLGIYLTNTLEEAAKKSERIIAKAISDEAEAAANIKREKPLLVIMGNPPYSGVSANRSRDIDGNLTFIGKLIQDYKLVDGAALNEKKHWLNDDYVKFLRFAEWRITESNPKTDNTGLVGFITNNGYVDNPTFRGMRFHLLSQFSELYVYNLHGSSNKKERAPDGSEDVNVFDIQQGVAILLAARYKDHKGPAAVYYADLWGDRSRKYDVLNTTTAAETKWERLTPSAPNYLFVPAQDAPLEYSTYWSLPDIMPLNSSGITTARDAFSLDFEKGNLSKRIVDFVGNTLTDADIALTYDLQENYAWNLPTARQDLRATLGTHPTKDELSQRIAPLLYRPFNNRYIYYDDSIVWRTRRKVMEPMLEPDNVCLIATRFTKDKWGCLVSSGLTGHKALSGYDVSYCFPLFMGKPGTKMFSGGKGANFSASFLHDLGSKMRLTHIEGEPIPEGLNERQILGYIYAIAHCPGYIARYRAQLITDFPRIPLTSNLDLFAALAEKGQQLVALHLLRVEDAPQLDSFITQFAVVGSNEVTKVKYDAAKQRVSINDEQYFAGLPPETWNFCVGGYQVLEKWLKDRKGRPLTFDDIRHWQRTAVALTETQRLMREIDALIPSWPLA